MGITASICISSYNRPLHLRRCLNSIRRQSPGFEYEIVVADDGSKTDRNASICREFNVDKYVYLNRPGWTNPSHSWNAAFKLAEGEILIIQQADVIHATRRVIAQLCHQLGENQALLARVDEWNPYTNQIGKAIMTTSSRWIGFFLGSIHRRDIYRVGGNDTDFTRGAHEDVWLDWCLRKNGIVPQWSNTITGLHQSHDRPMNSRVRQNQRWSKRLLQRKIDAATAGNIPWCSRGGPWSIP